MGIKSDWVAPADVDVIVPVPAVLATNTVRFHRKRQMRLAAVRLCIDFPPPNGRIGLFGRFPKFGTMKRHAFLRRLSFRLVCDRSRNSGKSEECQASQCRASRAMVYVPDEVWLGPHRALSRPERAA